MRKFPNRRWPSCQIETMCLTHDGIFGDADASSDLRRRMSSGPKLAELCYRDVVPIERITHAVLLFAVLSDR